MRVVGLGELLLRLRSPGTERLLQGPLLEASYGGAEFNVLAFLARLGLATDLVTTLPEGALGAQALATIRMHGVGSTHVRRVPGRLGLYFLESGTGLRPPKVLYDRAGSTFALTAAGAFDFTEILRGAACLLLTGITPAVSAAAASLAAAAAEAAAGLTVPVCLDINTRAQLWALSGRDPHAALAPLLARAQILFAAHADAAICLPSGGESDASAFAAALFAAYPSLEVIVIPAKRGNSALDFELSATVQRRGGPVIGARELSVRAAVERIGAGDALLGGCLYGLLSGWSDARWLDFGVAAQALKHTIPGDLNLVSREEVEAVTSGATPLRVQR